jgi:hypothetical protein
MEREDKIEKVIQVLDDNHIEIIDTDILGSVIIDAQAILEKGKDVYDQLIEEGITKEDIDELIDFLGDQNILVEMDNISGVSFEDIPSNEFLYDSDLWIEDNDEEN